MLLWIAETTFITNNFLLVYRVASAECIKVSFDRHKWGEDFFLVSLDSMQDLCESLESLLALQHPNVKHFSARLLSSSSLMGRRAPMDCPISQERLGQLLQIESLEFCNMRFDESQSRLLASAAGTKMSFLSCELSGLFAEYYAAAKNVGARDLKFALMTFPIFTSDQMTQLSASAHLQKVRLEHMYLTQESARGLASMNLEELELASCTIEGVGEIGFISQLLLEQRGPRGLAFQFSHAHFWIGKWDSFCRAFRGNHRRLKSLRFEEMNDSFFSFQGYDFLSTFLRSLKKNCGLEEITFQIYEQEDARQTSQKVLLALRKHPTFLRLRIKGGNRGRKEVLRAPRKFCKEVAAALRGNSLIEEIEIEGLERSEGWDDLVTPLLQCNIYRKKIPGILATGGARAGLLGAALAGARGKHPSTMYTLLSSNRDCIARY